MKPLSHHIYWMDIVRITACFMVVIAHCCDAFIGNLNIPEDAFWSSFYGSLVRPCVPLFVMLSGCLLLPMRDTPRVFLTKRFSRILIPFLIWSVLYAVLPYLFGEFGVADMWHNFTHIPLNFNSKNEHFWYIYMLIGLYLYIPIFSPWVQTASRKMKEYFLLIWGITLFLPYVKTYFPQILGECDWNPIGTFYYFTGFTGYLLLGNYLQQYPPKLSGVQRIVLCAVLFSVGFLTTFYGFNYTTRVHGVPQELCWGYLTINVVLMTVGMFLLFQPATIKSNTMQKVVADVSVLSFGIFLVHAMIVKSLVHPAINTLAISTGLKIPLVAVVSFVLSYIIVKALSYLPMSKYIIG
ncbi:surface polysaccharide O-acyltransferase-like enzyme [Chitinophaga niastensis]|uniref:Surface polysaccharide O-acyltransferase-like enzyme n=1 Tax=Chitinophaga niastensis TaxID=536980 RepID=A0A2P8HPD1_CHINA|nr:acyltransferase family protein [Chitinophaga niastensis]PSL48080.1 surface polysaccharide O-acyltransferase-like enzyme [Chitinophaga niastensis]